MKVFITGGTGFVGKILVQKLLEKGHTITVLSRQGKGPFPPEVRILKGDPTQRGAWQDEVVDQEVIINLAGASIFQRWTQEAKEQIRNSRILTTQNLVDGLSNPKHPVIFMSTSAVGYYGPRGEEILTEDAPHGSDFLATLTVDWEKEAMKATSFGHRVITMRFGIVLGKKGGALQFMARPFRYFLGSGLGSGKQYFSWIHERDLVQIFLFLMERDIVGPVNCTSPNPVTNQELTRLLGKVLKRPAILPNVPNFVLRLVLGEFAQAILTGQRVIPKRLLEMGYRFMFPEVEGALMDLLGS
jgi:uncharacterized protein (TIGR01777 family)